MKTLACLVAVAVIVLGFEAELVQGRTQLRTICRVKGQEENTLHGLGIVTGLRGTGDSGTSLPTMRSLSAALTLLGSPLGKAGTNELKEVKNVALVAVTAVVPATGARQGDKIDCTISSIGSAKSLSGGRLFTTLLVSQDPHNPRVYATTEGPITIDNVTMPTTGRVHGGCRLEEDFFNVFTRDGKITLVLDKNHADFQVASEIADMINNSKVGFQSSSATGMAKAINQGNIEVTIPRQYAEDPVTFVSEVLSLPIPEQGTAARVVINERAGSIVISGDAEVGTVVVTHKNIVVETVLTNVNPPRFVSVTPGQPESPKLKALVEALNAVRVPAEDIIEIIKGIDRNGKLHAQLIIE